MATIPNQRPPRPAALPAGQPPVIEFEGVTLRFGDQVGIDDVTLSVPPGVIFGLIGPSGSGKTTTVRVLTGVYAPQVGNVRVLGQQPAQRKARLRERIGYVPQLFTLYPNLTVWENLNFIASIYGLNYFKRRERLNSLLDFVELQEARNRLGRDLSGGMQRRLSLACALVHDPALVFADEPTAGIDPVLRGKFWEHFRELRDSGHSLFVTTQYVGEVAYCDLVGVMREGRLLYVDTPEGLRKMALGGEVIRLVVDPDQARETAHTLLEHPLVSDVRRSRSTPGGLYVTVTEASAALPALLGLLSGHPTINVRTAEEYQPPYDDIFITLMERAELSND